MDLQYTSDIFQYKTHSLDIYRYIVSYFHLKAWRKRTDFQNMNFIFTRIVRWFLAVWESIPPHCNFLPLWACHTASSSSMSTLSNCKFLPLWACHTTNNSCLSTYPHCNVLLQELVFLLSCPIFLGGCIMLTRCRYNMSLDHII